MKYNNNIKSYFLLVIVLIVFTSFTISSISAETQTLGTFKKDSCIELIQICSNCTYNNITYIIYPNGSKLNINISMTKTDTFYNFTFCNTSAVGEYIVNGIGDLEGTKTAWNYDLLINDSGTDLSTSQSIIYFIALIISIILFLLCLFFTITIPYNNNRSNDGKVISVNSLKYLKIFLIPITYVFLLLIVGILRGITSDLLYINGISQIFNWIYWILLSFMFPLIVMTFFLMILNFLGDFKLNKILEHGGSFR